MAANAIHTLANAGVPFEMGLSDAELGRLEDIAEVRLCDEHREFLLTALPVGEKDFWPRWRTLSAAEIRAKFSWPIEGVVFDVLTNAFWLRAWGGRPPSPGDREAVARGNLALVPRLAPIAGSAYLPALTAPHPLPVFAGWQTDLRYWGTDLEDYASTFVRHRIPLRWSPNGRVPFWSDVVEEARDDEPFLRAFSLR